MKTEKFCVAGEGSQEYAALYTYILDDSPELAVRERPLVIVCPGGAYMMTSDREAELVAMQFLAFGYHAAVLRYSVAPSVYPAAVLELGRAIRLIRQHAEQWKVNTDQIVVSGFSAGGHMAASYCVAWNQKWLAQALGTESGMLRPNGLILGYPVITAGEYAHQGSFENLLGKDYEARKEELSLEKLVHQDMPRTFIWHTFEDDAVPVQNSLLMVNALAACHVSTEFHMFEKGGHGLSLANKVTLSESGFGIQPGCEKWMELAHQWMERGLPSA